MGMVILIGGMRDRESVCKGFVITSHLIARYDIDRTNVFYGRILRI